MSTEPKPLKILHIGKYFPPYAGGMETYLRDLMTEQARQGVHSSALVHRSELSLRSSSENYLADDQKLSVTRAAVWLRLLFTPISPTFPWLLHRLIREKKPEILHLHMPNASVFWALILPSARRLPWVIQWQSDVLASRHSLGLRLFYSFYRPLERMVLSRSKAIIASSPPYLDSSEPLADFRSKCRVVPLGLNAQKRHAEAPNPKTKPAGAPLQVLAIGRLTYYKGFECLIRAINDCEGVTLDLVGKGDEEPRLRALVQELGLQNRVTFHGHLDDKALDNQFRACDCLCLPSIERTESFGMVLLEAMQYGKPCVISNVPGSGMGWIVDDGVTGLHSTPENNQSLAKCLIQLRDDRDKITRLGEAGLAKYQRAFPIRISAQGVSGIYKDVLNSSVAN